MADENNPLKFFTAVAVANIAKAGNVPYVPHSEKGMLELLYSLPSQLREQMSQSRKGRGGGTVYHWTLFPEKLWPALDAEIQRRMPVPVEAFDGPSLYANRTTQRQRAIIERTRPPALWGGGPKERVKRPTFKAPGLLLAQALAEAGELETTPEFLPFEIRTVDRCLVRYDNKKFFSRDLNPYQQKEACINATADHPD